MANPLDTFTKRELFAAFALMGTSSNQRTSRPRTAPSVRSRQLMP